MWCGRCGGRKCNNICGWLTWKEVSALVGPSWRWSFEGVSLHKQILSSSHIPYRHAFPPCKLLVYICMFCSTIPNLFPNQFIFLNNTCCKLLYVCMSLELYLLFNNFTRESKIAIGITRTHPTKYHARVDFPFTPLIIYIF